MTEVLGYQRYGAQGGDIGRLVTVQLALSHGESLLGVHFNGLFEGRLPPPEAEQTPDERAWRRTLDAYNATQRDYATFKTISLKPSPSLSLIIRWVPQLGS